MEQQWATPATTRSRIMLEVASELVGLDAWERKQADVSLHGRGQASAIRFAGSDTPAAVEMLTRGEADVALINPAAPLAVALRGNGASRIPTPVRVIAVLPSYDQIALAIAGRTGLTSLAEVKDRRYPLRLSLRGQPDHSIHSFVEHILGSAGFSLQDLRDWGGQVSYDPGFNFGRRLAAVARGEVDAIFDEAVEVWVEDALTQGMRMLPLEEPQLQQLEQLGYRRAMLAGSTHPALPADVPTLDFSGWPIFALESTPDEIVLAFCAGLEARKDCIPWEGEGPLPLDRMCRDTPEGPLVVPLHRAAERYWRERGYLS